MTTGQERRFRRTAVYNVVFTTTLILVLQVVRPLTASSSHQKFALSSTNVKNVVGNNASIQKNDDGVLKKFKLIQVQIIHRHGDRTPITPMKDESFWSDTLPSPSLLTKIALGTNVIRDNEKMEGSNHAASGRGPFGKLTQLGLLQMVEIGSRIREQISLTEEDSHDSHYVDDEGHAYLQKGRLFSNKQSLHPTKIKVRSTDFPRTLQSVQALLVGLFPDGLPEGTKIDIDARHTNVMIPDPQPRMSTEQIELEKILSQRKHLLDKDIEMKPLANRISKELKPFISDDANSVIFGIGEEGYDSQFEDRPLSWSQLSEIMTCLKARGMLPDSITKEEYEMTRKYAAWKWFENLSHKKLAYLSMKPFMDFIMKTLHLGQRRSTDNCQTMEEEDALLHIYSAHDSSLIGLMCAFRLQQPSQWPEYGSYLKIELFEACPIHENDDDSEKEYYVRFSLNDNVLKCTWGEGEGSYLEAKEMIPLHHLDSSIKSEHGH